MISPQILPPVTWDRNEAVAYEVPRGTCPRCDRSCAECGLTWDSGLSDEEDEA